jgi:hypothetical protein
MLAGTDVQKTFPDTGVVPEAPFTGRLGDGGSYDLAVFSSPALSSRANLVLITLSYP